MVRTFFEKLQLLIAEKTPSTVASGRGRHFATGILATVALIAVVATAVVVLRSDETEQVASAEPSAEVASAAPVTEQEAPDIEADEEAPDVLPGNAKLGGIVPTTSTPPPETNPEPEPEPEPEPAPAPAPVDPTPPPAGGPSAEAWAKLRDCEASGRYDAVNPAGYYGAYQFNQGTWDSVAISAGRSDLVGVNPAKASPADQDAMAFALYASRGAQPWPTCGRFL